MEDSKKSGREKQLITFLEETKSGKYVPIDEVLLSQLRIIEQDETVELPQDDYYYSVG
jgi:hypothetical protein